MASPFRSAVEARDADAIAATLAPDVTFRSPVVHKPYQGREAAMQLIRLVMEVFDEFEYTDELHGDGSETLVFRARVGDREVQGLDYLRIGSDGLAAELTVMVRPLSGLTALAEAMRSKLVEAGVLEPSAPAA